MPYRNHRESSPRELLAAEVRLCFGVAVGGLLVGGGGWVFNSLTGWNTPLPVLTVVGAIYGLMGLDRALKLALTKSTNHTPEETPPEGSSPELQTTRNPQPPPPQRM